ncbi:BEL1-like homeodomain protein 9, partial [Mucuna pruriens]
MRVETKPHTTPQFLKSVQFTYLCDKLRHFLFFTMAEGFEHYHVPQQSRRDKLRVFAHNQACFLESSSTLHPSCPTLPSLLDPSHIPSDLLACATKEEGSNLMMGGVVNGDAIQVINSNTNNNPFLYQLQNLREFNNSYNDGSEMMVFKPEPLSLSLSSHSNLTQHPLELNLQRYGAVVYGDKGGGGCVIPGLVGGNGEASRNSVPLGPFTGYASILKGSRFSKPAQQLLEELGDVG